MKKILVIADGLFTKEKLFSPEVAEKFKVLEEYGYTYDVATDTTAQRMGENATNFVRKIESEGPEWVEPDQEIMDKIKDAEVLLAHFSGVNRKMIEAGEKLELIGVMRSGVENVNLEAATDNNVKVLNAPGRVSEPVADFAVAMMLVESRNICRVNLKSTGGKWPKFDMSDPVNATMRNFTVGLVGFGMIGQKVAKRLKPFNPKIVAYDPYPNPAKAEELGVKLVSLDELCKVSDIVSIHARLSPESEGMFGEEQFNQMKPTAIFINTAGLGWSMSRRWSKHYRKRKFDQQRLMFLSRNLCRRIIHCKLWIMSH